MTQTTEQMQLVDKFGEFFRGYYADEIKQLAQKYPNEQRSLYVDWMDLYQYDPDVADDYLDQPNQLQRSAEEALRLYDLPIDVTLGNANVRVRNLHPDEVIGVGEIRADDTRKYTGVKGQMTRITQCRPRVDNAAFECQLCGTLTRVPQSSGGEEFQEPHQCEGCERQGPFQINYDQSEFIDVRKLRLKQPPEDAEGSRGGHEVDVVIEGDLAEREGSFFEDHASDQATVYGTVELKQRTSGRKMTAEFDHYLMGDAIDFDSSKSDIEPAEYKDKFAKHANSDKPYQAFWNNIQPRIVPVGNWPLALQMATLYLFASPRVNPEGDSAFRGDIHYGIFGGPGVGKSMFKGAVAYLSPDCENRTATGLSSDVGLTAAAVKDGFDGDKWTLSPGILARAGDHVILDEIDKTDADLVKINDALEGDQLITVDKGGIRAELKTRVGFMAIGNPKNGRFLDDVPFKEQIEIENSLWSRFDGIVILKDDQDTEQDGKVAKGMLQSYREDAAREKAERNGEDVDLDQEATNREVSREVMRAWVQYARENVFPELTDEVEERLREFYVDIREDNAENPPTARTLGFGIRGAVALARVRLSETVSIRDAEMVIQISKALLGQSVRASGGEGILADEFTEVDTGRTGSQKDRREKVVEVLDGNTLTVSEVADQVGYGYDTVSHDLEKLVEAKRIDKLPNNRYSA